MKAVILAGGLGTRLGLKSMPKPMAEIGGKPLLEHQILLLKRHGILDIIACTGHLSEKIEGFFGNGKRLGVHIEYSRETKPMGTAGCVKKAERFLDGDFLVIYGDVMVNMDLMRLIKTHEQGEGVATIVVHPNDHPQDSDLVEVDGAMKVSRFLNKPHPPGLVYQNLVNAGLYVFTQKMLDYMEADKHADLAKETLPKAVAAGEQVCAYRTAEYLKDVGTHERLMEVRRDFESGKIGRSSLRFKRNAIFLDRDGVLNEEVNLLHRPEQLRLIEGAAEAVKKINGSEYLAIVVTNQPVVARNLCTEETLAGIHKKLEAILGNAGAVLDAIYYCPHHPDSGYPEENRAYKIKCSCRKPAAGLILNAARDFNIDLKQSFMVGDRGVDIQTGANAGMKTVLIGGRKLEDKYPAKPDLVFNSLLAAVDHILGAKKSLIGGEDNK